VAYLQVSSDHTHLLRGGQPFFYLADTAWAAFSHMSLADWADYLSYRKLQGFNALQISILPITHDTSMGDTTLDPFLKTEDGWDFSQYNQDYFNKAVTMVEMAVAQDFVPVLGVLWCSYVPGTRCSQNSPIASAMPLSCVEPYARHVASLFKPFDPVFFISGDTRFESPDEAPYYMAALEAVRDACPEALLTMHLHPEGDLPDTFCQLIDFYMYQSGHGAKTQNLSYTLAEKFRGYSVKRPIVNSEPCYEGHGRIGERTRFNAFDIRKATWQSLLAGAKMGVAYGGHGIWSFHREGLTFLNAHRSFEPYHWRDALTLPGGWDVGFARWLYDHYRLVELEPSDLLRTDDPEIRLAASQDMSRLAIYAPYPFDIELNNDLGGYDVIGVDLADRRIFVPEITAGTPSTIHMVSFNTDVVFIATQSERTVNGKD
jgi:hypothetical protein